MPRHTELHPVWGMFGGFRGTHRQCRGAEKLPECLQSDLISQYKNGTLVETPPIVAGLLEHEQGAATESPPPQDGDCACLAAMCVSKTSRRIASIFILFMHICTYNFPRSI